MGTFIEIMRRVRFVWALGWLGGTVALAIYSPAILPLRIIPPLTAALAPYLGPMPLRLALTWAGVWVSLALAAAAESPGADVFGVLFIVAPGGAVLILLAAFLFSPLLKKGA